MTPPTDEPPTGPLKPGDDCGPYEIVSSLGRGGYGTVYKAVHIDTDEEIALKIVIHRYAEDKRAGERLVLEANAVRRVHHANVVGYRDAGMLPGGEGAWLALELVRGQTLHQILRERGRLPLKTVLHLGVQLCEGLAKIHEVPLVHRDIKPMNIMVTPNLTLKIIDLGIVRTKKGAGTTRQVGSGYYSAPDYLRLSGQELENTIDPRWDLFSAGVVLWEALAGHHPLRPNGEDLSLGGILARYIQDRRLLRLSLPDLPGEVADIVAKAVEFDPAKRWQSAAELGNALQQQMRRCLPEPRLVMKPARVEQPRIISPSGTRPLSARELAMFRQADLRQASARTAPLPMQFASATSAEGGSAAPAPAVKPRTAPMNVQRAIVQAYEAATGQAESDEPLRRLGDDKLRQQAQQRELHEARPSQAPALAATGDNRAPTPFLQRQLSQRQFNIALAVLITIGAIVLLLGTLHVMGVA